MTHNIAIVANTCLGNLGHRHLRQQIIVGGNIFKLPINNQKQNDKRNS